MAQGRTYGVGDSILAVTDGNYNRRFDSEIAFVDIDLLWSRRKQPPDTLQMSRASPLHIELYIDVFLIDICEVAAVGVVARGLLHSIQRLCYVEYICLFGDTKTQVVPAGKSVVVGGSGDDAFENIGLKHHQSTEVEVVSESTPLIVDITYLSIDLAIDGIIIGIYQSSSRRASYIYESLCAVWQ